MMGVLVVMGLGLALALRLHEYGRRARAPIHSGAIVVLGAKVNADGTAGPALSARVEHAVTLFHEGHAQWLLLSGRGTGPKTEAEVARALAVASGVTAERCVMEAASQSTFENARCAARELGALGVDSILLVTDDFHAYRAAAHFRRAGLVVRPAPVRRSLSVGSRLAWTGREVLALLRRPWLVH